MDPEDDGAVAVIVNVGAPDASDDADEATPLLRVTVQVSSALAVFRFVQDNADTPVPAVAAVAVTLVGN